MLWVVPTESSREKLLAFLVRGARCTSADAPAASRTRRISLHLAVFQIQQFQIHVYIAPKYGRPVEDEALLALVRQNRPAHVVVAVGGGIQDKLGLYLLERLDYRPAIHCIGAALGFLTGDQVRIPDWADKYYVGWFFRSLAQPTCFYSALLERAQAAVDDLTTGARNCRRWKTEAEQ